MRSLLDFTTMPTRAIRESARGVSKLFFYTSAPVTVPAITGTVLGTVDTRINVDGDAQFVAASLSGEYLVQTTGLMTYPELLAEPEIQIQEEGTGFLLFDRPLRWGLVVGTGRKPFGLKPPYVFPARSTVLITFRNPETIAYTVTVTLGGFKIYLK